ncbi:MAG: DUF6624 domain-containing protein [Myxococcota bacterium]
MSASSDHAAALLAMAARDLAVRERLAADGSLFDGYHPHMEHVHLEHAARLSDLIDDIGWPNVELVGAEAAEAAWLILQHAISMPALQRRGLALLETEAAHDRAEASNVAMLEDRIRVFEGRAQRFGTQFDWDANGQLSPHPIEDPAGVDARRREVGLPPLDETTAKHRRRAREEGEHPPDDAAARRAQADAWARRVGWRD